MRLSDVGNCVLMGHAFCKRRSKQPRHFAQTPEIMIASVFSLPSAKLCRGHNLPIRAAKAPAKWTRHSTFSPDGTRFVGRQVVVGCDAGWILDRSGFMRLENPRLITFIVSRVSDSSQPK